MEIIQLLGSNVGSIMQLAPWITVLITTHITIVGVTVYLHRSQAHRSVELGVPMSHFFRFWLWLTTAMVTKEWVAIHRKHHQRCEREGDPHSPNVFGISRVLWRGAELYRDATHLATVRELIVGTPDDWVERHIYANKHWFPRHLGIMLLLVVFVGFFGPIGLTMWAIQMAWIPFFAAGVVNGIGHWWGYRNTETDDRSTNIAPWGIVIGGEELHNNHHADPLSPKLSRKWWEFDIGWMYIRVLCALSFASLRKRA